MAGKKIQREKQVVSAMIEIYCKGKHKSAPKDQAGGLCEQCAQLKEYALLRLDRCKFGENKGNCGDCTIHCYKKDKREEIQRVMRYSGPRMIFYHPVMAFEHLWNKLCSKK